jgi:hypothetical protein
MADQAPEQHSDDRIVLTQPQYTDQESNGLGGQYGTTAPTVTPTTPVVNPTGYSGIQPTNVITNPLHQYASYTYNWSLWWLDLTDYNKLVSDDIENIGLYQPLSDKSYVIAEDSGLFPNQRLPEQAGLNYQIQEVNFETVVGLNTSSRSSNMITGSMKIIEPYGVTFLDTLILAARRSTISSNYTQQTYMLELTFTGYDDSGNPIPESANYFFKKRFPIFFTGVKISVSTQGAIYNIEYIPISHRAWANEHSTCPNTFTIKGSTVQGVLDDFANQLNNYWLNEVKTSRIQYADSIKFTCDDPIGASEVQYSSDVSLTKTDPSTKLINANNLSFTIPYGMRIIDVIDKVVIQSSFITKRVNELLSADNIPDPNNQQKLAALRKAFTAFKSSCAVSYKGRDSSGAYKENVLDTRTNTYRMAFEYKIQPYTVYDSAHPLLPSLADATPFVVKDYHYIYSGKNIDILGLQLDFDTTYYTATIAYPDQYKSTQTTPTTAQTESAASPKESDPTVSPVYLSLTDPNLSNLVGAVVNPTRYRTVVANQSETIGLNVIDSPSKILAANAVKSLYSRPSGDMVTVDLSIVGDPTFIKQDDWLYQLDAKKTTATIAQDQYVAKFGHLRMDNAALIVKLTINTPVDIDTDWTNKGLVFPEPGTSQSLFSGLYKVLTIDNSFTDGQFRQVLKLVRLMNSDYQKGNEVFNAGRTQNTDSAQQRGAGVSGSAGGIRATS